MKYAFVQNKKKDTNEFNSKYKQTQTHKINLWLSEGKGEERLKDITDMSSLGDGERAAFLNNPA